MVTKFSGKFAIFMLKKHKKICRCGLTHLDATPTFKNLPNTYASPCITDLLNNLGSSEEPSVVDTYSKVTWLMSSLKLWKVQAFGVTVSFQGITKEIRKFRIFRIFRINADAKWILIIFLNDLCSWEEPTVVDTHSKAT